MNSNEPKLARADSYDDLANDYERVVVPILRPMAKRLLQFIDVRPGWRVLDAGTGTGLLALAVAPRVGKTGKIIGIDLAEKMLAIARRKAAHFGFEQCEFRRGDLENLDFTADSFDVVLSQFALHHTNFPRALAEIARVLKPSGVFVMQDWSNIPIPAFEEFFQTLAAFRAADESEILARGRAQSELTREFFDSFGTELGMRTALNEAGFTQIETHVETYSARVNDVDAFIELACAAPRARAQALAMNEAMRANWRTHARQALARFVTSNGFEWSYPVLAMVARKFPA